MKRKVRRSFRNSAVYEAVREIKHCLGVVRKEIKVKKSSTKQIVSIYPKGQSRGKVLFSYILDGFLLDPCQPIPKTHTNIWQSLKMAETFVELGYEVDAIHHTNHSFVPKGNYSFIVDVRHNLHRLAPLLGKDCVKIMHLDTASMLFHNAAEAKRLLKLQERRGITLRPQRFQMPNLGIENADYGTTTGNDFTVGTFNYANKKIFKLPSPCGITLDWLEKDWDQCRKRFLWFSSSGLVHKGLDLALEAFRAMPDFHLTVCAPLELDKDFVRAYHGELYETHNINTIGWVNIDSSKFRDITATCGSMLHLSCSEGGAPSVKICMHAGLIPVVSYESGVDVNDFGFMLKDCSIANIKNIIKHVATLSQNEFQQRAHLSWETARRHYTRENFVKEYRKVVLKIIEDAESKEEIRFKKYV